MNKKINLTDLDIPDDDIDCWNMYPNYKWVYDLSKLLDLQNIPWSPYKTPNTAAYNNLDLYNNKSIDIIPGVIYADLKQDDYRNTEVFILKGEIKLIRHINSEQQLIKDIVGHIELRVNAFVTLYFSKFTGIVLFESHENQIHRIRLRPHDTTIYETDIKILKLINRIYKKNNILTGLTDQALQETLTS